MLPKVYRVGLLMYHWDKKHILLTSDYNIPVYEYESSKEYHPIVIAYKVIKDRFGINMTCWTDIAEDKDIVYLSIVTDLIEFENNLDFAIVNSKKRCKFVPELARKLTKIAFNKNINKRVNLDERL